MHLKRWITAIVTLPGLLYIIVQKNVLFFSFFICIICLIALWEYFNITISFKETNNKFQRSLIPLVAFFFAPAIILSATSKSLELIISLIAINFIISVFISLFLFKKNNNIVEIIFKQTLSVIYIPLFLAFLVLIRNEPDGIKWLLFFLAVIFAGDTGAYYTGTYFGKHKLCPAVSPGKTIEGAFGGLSANLLIGILAKVIFMPDLKWITCILFCLSIGIAGQVGDLFESELKRTACVKDSGALLPGHGGILDRIDALLFAAPAAYLFIIHYIPG